MRRLSEDALKHKRWIRLYTEIIDDRKVQRLAPNVFKVWINCLAIAGTNSGKLLPIDDMSWRMRMSDNDLRMCIDELVLCGLLDIDAAGHCSPHNWGKRQFHRDAIDPTNAERQKRFRGRAKRRETVSETAGVTDSVTDTVTQNRSVSVSASDSESVDIREVAQQEEGVSSGNSPRIRLSVREKNGVTGVRVRRNAQGGI